MMNRIIDTLDHAATSFSHQYCRRRQGRNINTTVAAVSAGLIFFGIVFPLGFQLYFSAHQQVVHVVLVAGDDNVNGYAQLSHLEHVLKNASATLRDAKKNPDDNQNATAKAKQTLGRYQHLWNSAKGNWTRPIAKNVFVYYERKRHEPWQMGPANVWDYGAKPGLTFGPEVEMAHTLGEAFAPDPVVIIKAGYDDRTLYKDWKTPSRINTAKEPLGYAWVHTLQHVKKALSNIPQFLPIRYKKHHRVELAGVIWWHGYSDVYNGHWIEAYTDNLLGFIKDVRKEFHRPHLPIVIAEAGAAGIDVNRYPFEPKIRAAQKKACKIEEEKEKNVKDDLPDELLEGGEGEQQEHGGAKTINANDKKDDAEATTTTSPPLKITQCVATSHIVGDSRAIHRLDSNVHYFGISTIMIDISNALAGALVELYFLQDERLEQGDSSEESAEYQAYMTEQEEGLTVYMLLGLLLLLGVASALHYRRTGQWNPIGFFIPSFFIEEGDDYDDGEEGGEDRHGLLGNVEERHVRFADEIDDGGRGGAGSATLLSDAEGDDSEAETVEMTNLSSKSATKEPHDIEDNNIGSNSNNNESESNDKDQPEQPAAIVARV